MKHRSKSRLINPEAEEYLTHLGRRGYSPRTTAVYRNALEHLLLFLAGKPLRQAPSFVETSAGRQDRRWQEVRLEDLEAWRLAMIGSGFEPSSLEIYLRAARQFFAWLEKTQRLFSNPAVDLVIPKPPRKLLPVPSESEIRRLLAAPDISRRCGLRDRAWLETAYATGARREELQRLTIFDVDLDGRTLRVLGKGRRERILPLGRQAALWLGRYIREARVRLLHGKLDEAALWIDLRGKQLGYGALQQILRTHSLAAKISRNLSPHSLRRACATHMLRRGAHPIQLQMLLGHATLKTLGQYLRATITDLQKTHARSKPGR